MKKILIGVAGSIALGAAAPALAADLPARTYSKAPVVPSPIYDWSGFYIGVNAGGGSADDCWDLVQAGPKPVNPPAARGCHSGHGGTAGAQIGYRWQAANWVFGAEAQGNWAGFKGSRPDLALGPSFGDQSKVNAFGLFTGQVGYTFNNVLLYAKGGAAVVHDKYSVFVLGNGAGQPLSTGSETRWGGAVGAGIEFGFAPHWSVALEYDHLFMGTRNVQLNAVSPGSATSTIDRIREDVDIGTVRVNYSFGGPVVAKY
jgi:outer membrane immunogenic protein